LVQDDILLTRIFSDMHFWTLAALMNCLNQPKQRGWKDKVRC